MTTTTVNNPGQGNLKGKLGTWLMILATAALAFVMFVEFVNILFYDPFSDEKFLFKLAGSLSDVKIGPLTYLMFGSLLVALMMMLDPVALLMMMFGLHVSAIRFLRHD